MRCAPVPIAQLTLAVPQQASHFHCHSVGPHEPSVMPRSVSYITYLSLLSCHQSEETAFIVRAFSFAHVELMDGILQMRLILDRGGLRYLPLRLADQGWREMPW